MESPIDLSEGEAPNRLLVEGILSRAFEAPGAPPRYVITEFVWEAAPRRLGGRGTRPRLPQRDPLYPDAWLAPSERP